MSEKRINVGFTNEDIEALQAMAAKMGLKLSSLVRMLVREQLTAREATHSPLRLA